MLNIIKTAALSAMIGLGSMAAIPSSASADSLHFSFGGHGGPVVGVQYRRDDMRRVDPRRCTAGQAVRKAERMGMRRAYVRGENRNTIRVAGRVRGGQGTIVFAKAPGCPVIR